MPEAEENEMLTNRSMPRCTVIPEVPYSDVARAIDWLCNAFGFTLRLSIANHRAQLNVGEGAIALTEQRAPDGQQSCSVMVRVENVDHHHELAGRHGARILSPPQDHPYGERQYSVEDFEGHRWTFSQSIADIDPETWGGTPGRL
jgi:uncharacterized glyoxalase superfamily protein PhnB